MSQDELSFAAGQSTRALLRQLGVRPQKRLSQSFLTDVSVCKAIADAAGLEPTDEVLEIGPGLGILTRVLLDRVGRVVAVELDRVLAASLPELARAEHLEVVQGDALKIEPTAYFSVGYKLVANLPYQITSPVLTKFLTKLPRPTLLVLMIQREVAERLIAPVGQASYLSIMAQTIANVRLIRRVSPGSFFPRPRIESAVVRLEPRADPLVDDQDVLPFLNLVRAGFTQPRKTLANSLSQGRAASRLETHSWLGDANIDPGCRPQSLTIEEWLRLFHTMRSA